MHCSLSMRRLVNNGVDWVSIVVVLGMFFGGMGLLLLVGWLVEINNS